jgi:murein DD-endopeptidase MepM/ murein hydrolase activator NlpD
MRVLVVLLVAFLVAVGWTAPTPAAAEPARPAPVVALWSSPLGDPPRVSRPFDPPDTPYAAGHRGVDLTGSAGAAVHAAGAGVVVFAGMVAGRPVVSVDHPGGLRTTYEPVEPAVGAGARVDRGTVLGVLVPGHAGCPTDACLHWGLRRGEAYLDPLALLRPPRIRLLPLY